MILYFSGYGYKPEKLFKKTSLMLSFFKSLKNPEKRFHKIYKQRKKQK